MAFSLTWDAGCEYGGGVSCSHGPNKANFFGVTAYDRTWFDHDLYAVTIGGGLMNNPGRYLAALPPINGAPASFVCNNGSTMGADNCANESGVWLPDLRTREVVGGLASW